MAGSTKCPDWQIIDGMLMGDGRLSVELLQRCLNSNENELLTWQYIAKLIETDE